MDNKLNILLVHNYYQIPGGEDTVLRNEKKMLEEQGHKVILYTRDNSEIHSFSWFRKLTLCVAAIFNFRTYKDIKSLIKEQKIDIVHVHNTLSLISPSVYYAVKNMGIPIVQTIHNFRFLCPAGTFYREKNICEECVKKGLVCAVKYRCYKNSFLYTLGSVMCLKIHRKTGIYGKLFYICLTEFNKEKLLYLTQIDKEHVFVKPNYVEPGWMPDIEARENQYIFVGRLDEMKGIVFLLQAWKKMGTQAPQLAIYGTGPMERWCKDYIEKNRLSHVEMKGCVSNHQMREIIATCKALIFPTQWYEGMPMCVIEAFASGTPVIGSNIGNTANMIIEGVTGYKFDGRTPESLTEAMEKLRGDHEIYRKTREWYEMQYSKDSNYKMLMNIYDYAIKNICK